MCTISRAPDRVKERWILRCRAPHGCRGTLSFASCLLFRSCPLSYISGPMLKRTLRKNVFTVAMREDANSPFAPCRRRASTCTKQQHSGPPHWLRPGRTSPSRSRWGSRCMLRVAGWLPHFGCCLGRWRCAGWQPDDSVVLGSAAGMLSVRLPVGVFELGCLKPKDRLR